MNADDRILILGAGPTGLGAAWRLEERGYSRWLLVDGADTPGGLASSVLDSRGFTWDLGGHVLFSHYEYFDRLMDELLPGGWAEHVREAWVWMRGRFIPYPLQNNIWRLSEEELIACLDGLLTVNQRQGRAHPARTFRDWIVNSFGEGLAEVFLLPYNRKVWAYDPAQLDVGWMGERVALVDLRRILRNLVWRQDDCGWGPNARFRFPLRGGTGAIWWALCNRLPSERVQLGHRAVRIVSRDRTVWLDDGTLLRYDALLSSVPLDCLLGMLSDRPDLSGQAVHFKHSASHIVGVGLRGQPPPVLATKCWMYFPEPDAPFYRVTVFSNYSSYNVPEPGRTWSLLCEVSESPESPVDAAGIVEEVLRGLRWAGFLTEQSEVISLWHRRLEYGYPTPFLGRDEVLRAVEPELRQAGIWSRGRFGGWKYEVSNQDHSLMQGVEAIDHLLDGTEEKTYFDPAGVNAGRKAARG